MGLDLGTIFASIGLNTAPLTASATKAEGIFKKLDKTGSTGMSGWNKAGLAAAAGIGVLAFGLAECVKAAEKMQVVDAETNAILTTTGGVSGMTAKAIDDLGGKVQNYSGIQRTVVKGAEQVILGFTNVRNAVGAGRDIFTRATESAADLSKQFGMDMPSAAKILGKALQDPTKGMTMLRRAGIVLTESQKDVVTQFAKAGDMAGAQKAILDALDVSYGQVAEAYGTTLAGKIDIAKGKFHDMAVEIGNALLPVLSDLAGKIASWDWTAISKGVGTAVTDIGKFIDAMGKAYDGTVNFLSYAADKGVGAFDWIDNAVHKLDDLFGKLTGRQPATPDFTTFKQAYQQTWNQLDIGMKTNNKTMVGNAETQIIDLAGQITKGQPLLLHNWQLVNQGISSAVWSGNLEKATAHQMDQMAQAIAASAHVPVANVMAILDQMRGVISAADLRTPTGDSIASMAQAIAAVSGQPIAAVMAITKAMAGVVTPEALAGASAQEIQGMAAAISGQTGQPVAAVAAILTALQNQLGSASLYTQPVQVTPPNNIGDVWNGIRDFFAWNPIPVPTQTQVNPVFDHPYDAGVYIGQQLAKGAGAAKPSVTMNAAAGGGAAAPTGPVDALTKAYDKQVQAQKAWSDNLEATTGDERHAAQAVFDLASGNMAAVVSWRNMNAQLAAATTAVDTYQAAIDKTQGTLDTLNAKLQTYQNMKLKGEGAASDKSFAQDEKSKKLQLQIMQAEDAHNYALAAQLQTQKDIVDRQKEESDLQTSITYDPQHRALEKLLDPLAQQEMSYANIVKAIKSTQSQIAYQNKLLVHEKVLHDQASLAVDNYSKIIDAMTSNFLKHYQEMTDAAKALADVVGGTPSGGTGGGLGASGDYTPVSGGGTAPTLITVPLYLDGKLVAKSVSLYQGAQTSSRARSGGRY